MTEGRAWSRDTSRSGVEERWQRTWEEEGPLQRRARSRPHALRRLPPAAQRDRAAAHRPRAEPLRRRLAHPLEADAGLQHALPAGLRPRRHLDSERGRAALIEEGTSRQELGREAFVERVWEWLHEYGGKILDDFRRIGASLDYRRSRMTMDDGYSRAVMQFFVHLYSRGWIYRANRIINWCPYHETSLSDLELEHEDVDDTLSTIRYPLADGDGFIPIATVRPATIPADVAVAVHPDDERYKHLIGREVIVPWTENRVPVIADERVERRVRYRCAEDHACTRSDRLRDRPRPRPAGAELHRPRRPGHRGRARRADAGRGRREDPRLVPRARPAREARALSAQRRVLRALPLAHRAAHLAAVVVLDGADQAAPARGAPERRDPLPPGEPAPLRDRLAR